MKIIFRTLIIFLISISLTGCQEDGMSQENIQDQITDYQAIAEDYLKSAYPNEEFTIVEPTMEQVSSKNTTVWMFPVASKESPNEWFQVFVDVKSEEPKDNRVVYNVEQEFDEEVRDLAGTYWENPLTSAKISLGLNMPEGVWDADTSLREFLSNEESAIPVIVMSLPLTKSEEEAEKIYRFLNDIKESGFEPSVSIYFDEDNLDNLNANSKAIRFNLIEGVPDKSVILEDLAGVK